jgi:hypothetical protein
MERRAYRHMERSGWLGHHVSKALVMHQANEVFETSVSRHLFADAAGRRHGRPKTGTWWDYTRIPGRASAVTGKVHRVALVASELWAGRRHPNPGLEA